MLDIGLRFGPYGKRLNPMGTGISLKKLRETPEGMDFGPLQSTLPNRIPKQHGAIDLAPDLYLADLDRLDARFSKKAEDARLLLIGRRHLRSNNSWMHNTERLMKGRERCTLMIHPQDAERIGVKSGEMVSVSSRVGQVEAPAEVTDDMMEGVVSLPHGFGHDRDGVQLRVARTRPGVSVNDLTDELAIDVSGNAAFSGIPVIVCAGAQVAAAE